MQTVNLSKGMILRPKKKKGAEYYIVTEILDNGESFRAFIYLGPKHGNMQDFRTDAFRVVPSVTFKSV